MSCGRCGKAILAQQGGSMCATCRSPAAQCSIWYVFFYPIPQTLIRTCPQPPSGEIYALPVRRLLARWPPGLLQAVLRRNAAGPLPSTTIAVVGGILAEISPSSSLPFDVAQQGQRVRRHDRYRGARLCYRCVCCGCALPPPVDGPFLRGGVRPFLLGSKL